MSVAVAEESRKPRSAYPSRVPTGVPWLGEAPAHWRLIRLRWTIRSLRNGTWGGEPDGENDIICVRVADFDRVGFSVRLEQPTLRAVTVSERLGRVLRRSDLLLEKSGGGELQPVGAVVQYNSDEPAVCSNFIARVVVAEDCESRFLTYFHAHLYDCRVNTRSIKQTTGIQNLDSYSYFSELAAIPPLDEQQAIAAFLDRETARIDALIAKKQRLIELLQEKRTALISHAVTKGLNPNAPMKPSGLDWLGDIPLHWLMLPLKFVASLQTGLTLGKKYDGSTTLASRPYLRVANVQDGYLDLDHITQVELPRGDVRRYELQAGDMLMTEGGDFDKLGRGYVWDGQIEGCLHQNHIFAVRPNARRLNSHFLACLTSSTHGKAYFTSTSSQTTNLASTNSTKLGMFPVLLPPLPEQAEILAQLAHIARGHDELIDAARRGVSLLREYRSALISAAVTGKIDVRGEVS